MGRGDGKESSKIGAKGRRGVEVEVGAGDSEADEEEAGAVRFLFSGEAIVSYYGSALAPSKKRGREVAMMERDRRDEEM